MGIKEYFTFTRRERSGMIGLLVIMLMIIILTRVFPPKSAAAPITQSAVMPDTVPNTTSQKSGSPVPQKEHVYKKYASPPRKQFKSVAPVEINAADTTALIALPGIGSKLASRIVAFREKLGGFYDVRQVGEVYGLQDSVFKKVLPLLRCDPHFVKKININEADKEQLKTHPYIRWNVADLLVAFRTEHGSFSSVDDLSKLEALDEAAITRIIPYITFH